VQIYFVLANMIAVPLTAMWVMPAGLIALFLMPLHLEALVLVPMGWGAQAIVWVARTTAALPAATIEVPHLPIWGICLFSVGLAWLGLWRTRRRLAGIVLMAVGLASPLADRPPDILVSADARLIAVRTPEGAFLQRVSGGSKFTSDAWAQYWAAGSFRMIPEDGKGVLDCQPDVCLLRPYSDRPGAMLVRGALHPAGCKAVSIIVSAEPARGLCPKPWPRLVDRFTVWRFGSTAIWLDKNGARVLTDRAERGDRPWVQPLPKPKKAASPAPSRSGGGSPTASLPPAAVDGGKQPEPARHVPSAEANNGG
jgi:competence protein ComEC